MIVFFNVPPNKSMKPTAPHRNTFKVFATTPSEAYLCLVR